MQNRITDILEQKIIDKKKLSRDNIEEHDQADALMYGHILIRDPDYDNVYVDKKV